jgi:hypothetical protein
MMAKRSVATAIVLSLVTCGIYYIIWMISLSNEVSAYNGENQEGGMEFLLTLITCGIYGIYWNYKMGQKLVRAKQRAGQYAQDNSILYLILSIFGLQIVSIAIMQSQANEL